MMPAGYMTFFKCDISVPVGSLAGILLSGIIVISSFNAYAAEPDNRAAAVADNESALEQAEEEFLPWVGAPEIPYSVPAPTEQPIPAPQPDIVAVIDTQHEYFSEKIVNFTKGIDQFFGDERYFQEYNKSVVQLNLNQTIAQGGSHPFTMEGQPSWICPPRRSDLSDSNLCWK